TGSGMPMRFADADGRTIDVYQAATQMTDESNQTYPQTIAALLDRALGPDGFYGVFTANMHTDAAAHAGSDAIVRGSMARRVPIVSAKQMLAWLDGRNQSAFTSISWSGGTFTFRVEPGAGASGLQGMLPVDSSTGPIAALMRHGQAVPFSVETIKGMAYAMFDAQPGVYSASYRTEPDSMSGRDRARATAGTSSFPVGYQVQPLR